MSKTPEQFNAYSEKQALEEAQKIKEKMSKGEAKDYSEAEMQIEQEGETEILENRPKDNEIEDPRKIDLPETPKLVRWKDSSTGEIFTSYPAICHDVHSSGGRMFDRWLIKWFDNPDEARRVDSEAREEAGSYVRGRKIYAELTKGATEGRLSFELPEHWTEVSPQKILSMAGFSEDQYHIRNDIGHWYRVGERGHHSVFAHLGAESWDGVSPSASLAQKNEEGIWEIGTTGLSNMFEGQSVHVKTSQVGKAGGWVKTKSVLSEMGVPDEKIISIKTEIETEKNKAREEFDIGQKKFAEELKKMPAFSCLPLDIQRKVEQLKDGRYIDSIPLLTEELRKEWGVAEKLQSLKEQGKILVNWGGHFRRMGSTNQRDFWVVCPDGTLRDSEDIRYRGQYRAQGDKHWRVVAPEELALTYYSENSGDKSHCEVEKSSINDLTPEQVERVHIIEKEINAVPNAFGLDPELVEKEKVRLEAIKEVYGNLPRDLKAMSGEWDESWSLQDIMSGLDIRPYDESSQKQEKYIDRINHTKLTYDTSVMGKRRKLQVIHKEFCADGILEMVAYEKWGGWNLSMRWRELSEDEISKQSRKPSSSSEGDHKSPTSESLKKLLSKFSKK